MHDHLFWVDCRAVGSNDFAVMASSTNIAMLGNLWDGSAISHTVRNSFVRGGVYNGNEINSPNPSLHCMKFAAKSSQIGLSLYGRYSERIVISDNVFNSGGCRWAVALAPTSSLLDERIRDAIIERNLTIGDGGMPLRLLPERPRRDRP